MASTFFQFKEFTVHQGLSAMKVSSDACVFGAYTARYLGEAHRVLDIGAGTGLLALMLAQRFANAQITAVEVEYQSYLQAKANFEQSQWHERFTLVHQKIQDFPTKKFDLVISNPPFFVNSLKSNNLAKTIARHTASLPFADLVAAAQRLCTPTGTIAVLLPITEASLFLQLADSQLFLEHQVFFKDNAHKQVHRTFLFLKTQPKNAPHSVTELTLKELNNNFTHEAIQLLKPYYLYL